MEYTVPNQQPRHTTHELAESVGFDVVLGELIAWLPRSTLNDFLVDFVHSLENGDFDDLIQD
jgi:hypothetical protein